MIFKTHYFLHFIKLTLITKLGIFIRLLMYLCFIYFSMVFTHIINFITLLIIFLLFYNEDASKQLLQRSSSEIIISVAITLRLDLGINTIGKANNKDGMKTAHLFVTIKIRISLTNFFLKHLGDWFFHLRDQNFSLNLCRTQTTLVTTIFIRQNRITRSSMMNLTSKRQGTTLRHRLAFTYLP